jgi:hypothetical protein
MNIIENALNVLSQYKSKDGLRNVTLIEASSYLKTWDVERYDFIAWRSWMGRNWYLSIYFSALYVALIFLGQRWMKNRPAFELRTHSIVWNIVMGIFCFTGFYRALPEVISVLMGPDGVHRSLCIL